MTRIVDLALGVMLFFPSFASAQSVTCTISSKFICSAGGCDPVQPTIRNLIDLSRQSYIRCDAKNCETLDARFSRSGTYIVVDVPGRGVMAKIAADMSEFLEVATIGTQALVSFGSCR